MAIALQQQKGGGTGAALSFTIVWTSNTTSGNLIVVTISTLTSTATEVSSITDSQSNTYSRADGTAASGVSNEIWYAKNITGGTTPTITVNLAGSVTAAGVANEYSGADTTAPFDKSNKNTGSGGTADSTATAATTVANEVVVGGVGSTTTPTVGTGYGHLLTQAASTLKTGIEDKLVSSTGTYNATFGGTTSFWAATVATFKAGSSDPTVNVSDTATTSEALTMQLNSFVNKSDTITTSEFTNQTLVDNPNVSDTLTTSESTKFLLESNVNKSDTITTSESLVMQLNSFGNVSDTITTSEFIGITAVDNFSVSDTITTSEFQSILLVSNPNVSDTITTSEALTLLIPTLFAIISDTLTTSESVGRLQTSFVNLSDSLTLSESIVPNITDSNSVNDSMTLSEAIAMTLSNTLSVSDTITTSESLTITYQPGFLSFFFNNINIGALAGVNITRIDIHNRPERDLTKYKLARRDGSKLINAEFVKQILTVEGYIANGDRTAYETDRDLLLQYLQPQEATIKVTQAGMNRNYTGTVSNVIWSANEGGLGVFSAEFLCAYPFGFDDSTTSLLTSSNITASSNILAFTAIDGSYRVFPTITVAVVSLTGGSSKFIRLTNPANGKAITVTRTWANSDSLVIDCQNLTVKVNGTLVDYTGVFPEWGLGDTNIQYDDSLTTRSVNLSLSYTRRWL